jgi:excisionase family DNA binding protein
MAADDWPLFNHLGPLGALDTAPSLARNYTSIVLAEWNLAELTDTAVLVISELVTNAVCASSTSAGLPMYDAEGRLPVVHMVLRSDRARLLIEVWDTIPVMLGAPVAKESDEYDESGRGLMIVTSLAESWGYQAVPGWSGKLTWSLLRVQLHHINSWGAEIHREGYAMTSETDNPGMRPLMTLKEVSAIFRVDPKTVTRWANAGKLNPIRTLGGHRRYYEDEVKALLKR